ncbi:MAG: uracil-DNA glycosylase [Fidelibacterota bacterium]
MVNSNKICKWYWSCPIRKFTEEGKLEKYWLENYCLTGNKNCVRYKMEKQGEFHPDNMLPNGEIRKKL